MDSRSHEERIEGKIPISTRIDVMSLAKLFRYYELAGFNPTKSTIINAAVERVASELMIGDFKNNVEASEYLIRKGVINEYNKSTSRKLFTILKLGNARGEEGEREVLSNIQEHKIIHGIEKKKDSNKLDLMKEAIPRMSIPMPNRNNEQIEKNLFEGQIEEKYDRSKTGNPGWKVDLADLKGQVIKEEKKESILIGLDGKEYTKLSDGLYYEIENVTKRLADEEEARNKVTITDEDIFRMAEESKKRKEGRKKQEEWLEKVKLELLVEKDNILKELGIDKPNKIQIELARPYYADKLANLAKFVRTLEVSSQEEAKERMSEGLVKLKTAWIERLILEGIMTKGE